MDLGKARSWPWPWLGVLLLAVACVVCAEERLPERFLPPRDFNPHAYHDDDVVDDAPARGRQVLQQLQQDAGPHPYALLARKRPREGRYPHHQPGDPVLYPHPLSVISELHRSAARAKLHSNQQAQQHRHPEQEHQALRGQPSLQQQVAGEDIYYPVQQSLEHHEEPTYRQQVLVYDHNEQPAPPQHLQHLQQPQQLQQLHQDSANYAFSYSVRGAGSGDDFAHAQARSGGGTRGEYRVRLPDGRLQIVSYVADNHGYRADVRYDEHAEHVHHHGHVPGVPSAAPPSPAAALVRQYSSPHGARGAHGGSLHQHQALQHYVIGPSPSPVAPEAQYVAQVSPSPAPLAHQYLAQVSPSSPPVAHQYAAQVSPSPAPLHHQYLAQVSPSPAPLPHQYAAQVSPSPAPLHHQYLAQVSPSPAPLPHQYVAQVSPSPAPLHHQYVAQVSPSPAPLQHQYFTPTTDATPDYESEAAPLQYLGHSTASAGLGHRQYLADGLFVTSTSPSPPVVGGDEGRLDPAGFIPAAATTAAPPPGNTASPAPVQFPRVPDDGNQQQQQQQPIQPQLDDHQLGVTGRSQRLYQPASRYNGLLLRQGFV